MILGPDGKSVKGSHLGISIRIIRAFNEEADRRSWSLAEHLRIDDLRRSCGVDPYETRTGQVVKVKMPKRYM